MNAIPPVRAIVALVALLAVVVGGAVALFALTPVSQRPDVWTSLGGQWPSIAAGAVALFAWLTGRSAHAKLDVISDQTNGKLTARIESVVRAVLEDFTAPPTGNALQLVPAQPQAYTTPTPPAGDPAAAPAPSNTRAG